jgi:hypothetical protein
MSSEVGNVLTRNFAQTSHIVSRPHEYSEAVSDLVHRHTEQILADQLFKNSQRYSNLLRFIVDRTLKGQLQDLKERVIGNEVFGRSPDYDTSADPTVRVAANEVRKRLINYYSKAGADQTVRIDIPVGTYVADFIVPEPIAAPLAEPLQLIEKEKNKPSVLRRWPILLVATVAVGLAMWMGIRSLMPKAPIERFWAPVVNGPGPVLLCLSSTPLNDVSATAEPNPQYDADPAHLTLWQFSQRNVNVPVGMMDVQSANDLSLFLQRSHKTFQLKPSQQISLADLRSSPTVVFGGLHNNWSMLLQQSLRFKFREQANLGLRWIEDSKNQQNRSWSIDLSAPYREVDSDYVLITRAQDPRTGQWWIGIGGLTAQGTHAANQVLIDRKAMKNITSGLENGWDTKNLQMVVQIKMVEDSPGVPRVIATHTW